MSESGNPAEWARPGRERTIPLLTAVADAPTEAALAAALAAAKTPLTVARRCVDLADLLAAAAAGLGQAVVLSGDLRQLDAAAVQRLGALGVGVVGLAASDDAAGLRLRQLGVTRVVSAPDAAEIAAAAAAAIADLSADPALDRILDWSASPYPAAAPAAAPPPPLRQDAAGRIIAVWGPTGAPGRTTVAVNLAAELAGLGAESLVVDADAYGGTVAHCLGVLDESAGVAAACRLANNGRLDADELATLSVQVRPRLRLLTGISRAERWPELRPAALTAALELSRAVADFVMVDCGFCLEQDEELAFDTAAPRRNGATLATLAAADLTIGIALADPIGLARYVRARSDLLAATTGRALITVVNRVRRGVVGPGDPEREIAAALERYAGVADPVMIPDDRVGVDAAVAGGRLLAEAAPKSPARAAIRALAVRLVNSPGKPRRGVLSALRASR
jgi:MinD-like ATPase involved in chromosome partitioning or flagellar assembly